MSRVVHFEVDDVDAALERVAANGGTALSEPQAVPVVGRHTYAADPAGNRFGLMEPTEGARAGPRTDTGASRRRVVLLAWPAREYAWPPYPPSR